MPQFTREQLIDWTGGRWTAHPTAPLTGFAIDTRHLRAGDVFVALRTEKRDGHEFLAAALANGASAALVSRPVPDVALPQLVVHDPLRAFQSIAREHRRRFTGPVVGVTGSAGKTSTKNLLAQLLGPDVLATEGNLNNHLGVPLTLTRLEPGRHRFAVIEAGISEPGEMATLAAMIEPDLAIVTLVAAAHTERLNGLDGVAREKAALPLALRREGCVVLPREVADRAAFQLLPGRRLIVERADVLRPSPAPPDTVFFAVSERREQMAVSIAFGAPPPLVFTLRRVSDGMAQNAVLAISTALQLGVDQRTIQTRLQAWAPAPLRGEVRQDAERLYYLDCYNANPASMADALASFARLAPPDSPRLYVLGGMEELGSESRRYHRELGASLRLRPTDHVLVIGDEADAVCAGARDAGAAPTQLEIATSLEPIAARVAAFRGAVFIKGSRKYRLEATLPAAAAPAASVSAH